MLKDLGNGDSRAVEPLIMALKDNDWRVRFNVGYLAKLLER